MTAIARASNRPAFSRKALDFTILAMATCILFLAQDIALAQGAGAGGGHDADRHSHGADGTGHDEVNMPGLRGVDATPEESAELAKLFQNFEMLERTVKNLPNGIETHTTSTDEDVAMALVSHVAGMLHRVDEGRDPQIIIQSPTLDLLFARGQDIETKVELIENGIAVTQTSDDPEIVATLQTHAAEVSEMVDRGMAAVHDMMMKRAGN